MCLDGALGNRAASSVVSLLAGVGSIVGRVFSVLVAVGRVVSRVFFVLVAVVIEVASVIELSEASGRVAAGLFMTEG